MKKLYNAVFRIIHAIKSKKIKENSFNFMVQGTSDLFLKLVNLDFSVSFNYEHLTK